MRMFTLLGAAAALALGAQAASAQLGSLTSSFRGAYVEGQVGGDRFQSEGVHDDKFGYGGAIGFDGTINDRWVIGPQAAYWRGRGENQTGLNGGLLNHKSFQEYSVGVRGGYLVIPKVLVYGIGGYAINEQRRALTAQTGAFYDHFSTDGYFLGGGAEYSITDMFYAGAGYRYSNYHDHTARQRLFATAGVRFK